MYHYDDAAPMTRNIAVGVGEIGVSGDYQLAEQLSGDSSVHVTNMALQQLNMAAFQSRHLRFSNEQLREVLDLMLKKNLRSVAVQCRFATVDCAVGTTGIYGPPHAVALNTPHWSNPPFLISDIRALWHSVLSARAPECQKLKMVG